MRIDDLSLVGFRCFKEASFHFQPGFNLIVGENGSGKTALLESLAVAAGAWLLGIRGYDARGITVEDVRIQMVGSNGEMSPEEAQETLVYVRGCMSDGLQLAWSRARKGKAGRTTGAGVSQLAFYAERVAEKVRVGQPVVLPLISYYGTGRLWDLPKDMKRELKARPSKADMSRFEGYRTSVDRRCSPLDFTQWMRRQAWIAFQEGKEPEISAAVTDAVTKCVEGARRAWYSAKLEQVLMEIKGRQVLPFENLSDGQRNMVAMIGDIAIKAAKLNPHLGARALTETPGVVLIDELDLHLHPRWQRRVVNDLKRTFPKLQFFCTTHSPQIIGEVPKEEVMILGHDGARPAPVAFGADTNWILRHVMGGEERNPKVQTLVTSVDDAMDEGDMQQAKKLLAQLRRKIGTDDEGEIARLDASIRNLEALAHEEN